MWLEGVVGLKGVVWLEGGDVVWCGVVWCGVVWCGVVWRGVVWCGVVWCGVAWCIKVGCWFGVFCFNGSWSHSMVSRDKIPSST